MATLAEICSDSVMVLGTVYFTEIEAELVKIVTLLDKGLTRTNQWGVC